MQPTINWQDSFNVGFSGAVEQFSVFLPRLLEAVIIFVLGIIAAKILRRVIVNGLKTFRFSKVVEKTPLELFLKNAELGEKIEETIGSVVYWFCLYLTVYTTVYVLGLMPLFNVLERILGYIPHLFFALFIFLFGVLLAGVVETVVKGALKSSDPHSARVFAKVASYLVVAISSLAAVAELGIASQFITILFMGTVFAFSLGTGLAIGLGGQDTVRKILDGWYKKEEK